MIFTQPCVGIIFTTTGAIVQNQGQKPMGGSLSRLGITLTLLEGLVAFSFLFGIPSKGENAFFLGYSLSRWLAAFLPALILLALAIILLFSVRNKPAYERIGSRVRQYLSQQHRLLTLLAALCVTCMAVVFLILVFQSPLAANLNTLRAVYQRSVSILVWAGLAAGQAIYLLTRNFREEISQKDFWQPGIVTRTILVFSVLFFCLFYWAILVTQDALFVAIEGWFWQFHAKEFTSRDFFFVIMAAAALIFMGLLVKHPAREKTNLLLLVVLAFALQAGFGVIEGQGFESLRLKFIDSFHKGYAEYAVDKPDLRTAMVDYERIYGGDINLGTKPPGALLVYILVQKATQLLYPAGNFAGRFLHLTQVISWLFPLIASLAVIPLYALAKTVMDEKSASLAGFFYILSSNFLLMPLSMDQFLLPLLFLVTMLITAQAVRKQSFWWSFFAGSLFYTAVYFSFSLLPAVGMAFFWFTADFLRHRKERELSSLLRLVFGFTAGILLLMVAFRFVLNYDIVVRYAGAFARHRMHKDFQSDLSGILTALLINNFEFLFWTGIPLILLAVSQTARSIEAVIRKAGQSIDAFALALLLTYLVLNFLGQTRSEVGRLWLYLVPCVSILATREAGSLFRKQYWGFLFVTALLLVNAFLTYKFQDFYF